MTPTRLPTLPLSGDLLRWLRADAGWPALGWRLRAAMAWKSGWGELNAKLSRTQLRDAPALRPPLLIVGPWRSGTTVMHELLTAATGHATPLTWQCMNPCAFQLLGKGPQQAPVARPMDGLEIGALTPQEDEFALLGLGVESAYRGFLQPGRLAELGHTLEQQFWLDQAGWLPRWEGFLQGVLKSLDRGGERLILKSPNHSFRLKAILRRFPDAQLVWMNRDPALTFRSNEKMWQAMFAEHGITGSKHTPALQAFLARTLTASAEALDWMRTELPAKAWVVCEQDAMLRDPVAVIQHVFERLALPGEPDAAALQAAIERTGRGKIDRYQALVSPELQPALLALQQAQERAIAAQGARHRANAADS